MPFKLLVHKTDDPSLLPDSFVFHQDRIVLGRDPGNDLPLPDDRRIISKQHATITAADAVYYLTDLGSKNFTYLNGDRLTSGQPYPIRSGDSFQIGSYRLTFEVVDVALKPMVPAAFDQDRTVFDASFVNPFEEDAAVLAATLRSIRKLYDEVAPSRRADALAEALRAAFGEGGSHEADVLVSSLIGGTALPIAPSPIAPPPVASPVPDVLSPVPPPVEAVPLLPPAPLPPVPAPAPATPVWLQTDAPRLHRVVDAVLRAVTKLVGAPWQFRYEFIGQTIMQAEEAAFLYEGDAEVVKEHLLAPSLPEETFRERLALLEEAIDDLALHQLALLDGYRASVQQGAAHLLGLIDPEAIQQEVAGKNAFNRLVPQLAQAEVLKRLQAQLDELRNEDWSAVERRSYRPAFIKAYLARMTSIRRPRGPSEF